ncbi:MAG: RNA polymerase sigma factor [Planctomycetota bacterium]|jgi:RNA polymerase sigma-70 factor (ECF subfamily)
MARARSRAGAKAGRPKTGPRGAESPAAADAHAGPARADPARFREIVLEYETPLLRFLRRLAAPDEAEDIAQEAFIRLHGALARPPGVRNVRAFLFKAAHNLALDHRRRRKARQGLKERAARELPAAASARAGVDDDENSPEGLSALVRRAACEKALEELRHLPDRQRRVLVLRVVQDFTLREIADVTGLTVGNAAYHLSAGLKELARRLKAAGVI